MSRSAFRQGLWISLSVMACSCGPQVKRSTDPEQVSPGAGSQAVETGKRRAEPQQATMSLFLSENTVGAASPVVMDDQVYAVWATPRADGSGAPGGDYSIDLYKYLESAERWNTVKHLGLAQIWGLPQQALTSDEQSGHLIVRYQSENSQIIVHLDRDLTEVNRTSLEVEDGPGLKMTSQGQLATASCMDNGSRIEMTAGSLTASVPAACQTDPWLHDLGSRYLVIWANEWPGSSGSGRDLFATVINKDTAETTPPARITSSDFEEHAVAALPGSPARTAVIWNEFDGTPGGESVQRSRTLFMSQIDLSQGTVTEPIRVENIPGASLAPQALAFGDALHLAWNERGSRESAVYVAHCKLPCTSTPQWSTPQRLGTSVGVTSAQFMTSQNPQQLSLAWVSGNPESARLNTMTFNSADRLWSVSSDLPEVQASIDSFWTVVRGTSILAIWSQTNAQGSHIASALVPFLSKQ